MCILSFCILKLSVKILTFSTLISVGYCFLLCMLAICVFTVSSCVWVCNGVEILRETCSCCHVFVYLGVLGSVSPPPLFIYFYFFSFSFRTTRYTKLDESYDDRDRVLSRSLHHYRPKHSWIQ
jgi:hypothetical protein